MALDGVRACLLHEEMSVNFHIPDLHPHIWSSIMQLFGCLSAHLYLPLVLGVDRPFPFLMEVHGH